MDASGPPREVYYRYDNVGTYVVCSEYAIAKRTRCGVRLQSGKLVIHSHRKRFAYPTKEEAKVAFIARKKRQLSIIREQIATVELILGRSDPFENTETFELALDDSL